MTAANLMLTLRYVVGSGWFIIAWSEQKQREVGGPFAGVQAAIDERAKLAAAFDHASAVSS